MLTQLPCHDNMPGSGGRAPHILVWLQMEVGGQL